ncbi:MAG: DNA topoisomerase VI subunit B [Candidatus Micrarchaeota archaeon]|nr:DNA topoisomerase VI subunit B [Candidatus Micrarchaeota archaeon]
MDHKNENNNAVNNFQKSADIDSSFENFREHSVAEFFKKNKQMLGFSGKVRSLTTIIHEYVTNSLDAAEERNILPEIIVKIQELEKNERYLVTVEDNAGGIPKEFLGKALGKILAGTKFHRFMQARGQQGIGAAGCTMFSYITTGKPIKAISKFKDYVVEAEISIDINQNEPIIKILREDAISENEKSGLCVIAEFAEVKYEESSYGVLEYLKRTSLVNPHLEILFLDPENKKHLFPRSSNIIPKRAQEVQPHPLGLNAHDIYELIKKDNQHRNVESTLINSLARFSKAKAIEIQQMLDFDLKIRKEDFTWEHANKLVNAIKKVKWIAPSLDSVVPIGKEQLEKAILNILNPQHYAITEREPKVYRGGIPFVVECAIAYANIQDNNKKDLVDATTQTKNGQKKAEVMRFANRVPLLFDAGNCAITEAVKSIDWKRYNIDNFEEQPITVIVNVSSVFIPYTGAGKQSISAEEEIVNEIRFALMENARNLQRFLSGRRREQEILSKKKVLYRYVEQLAKDISELSGKNNYNELKKKLEELIEKRYLQSNNVELSEEEIMEIEKELERTENQSEVKKQKKLFDEESIEE